MVITFTVAAHVDYYYTSPYQFTINLFIASTNINDDNIMYFGCDLHVLEFVVCLLYWFMSSTIPNMILNLFLILLIHQKLFKSCCSITISCISLRYCLIITKFLCPFSASCSF